MSKVLQTVLVHWVKEHPQTLYGKLPEPKAKLMKRILSGFGIDVQRDTVCDIIICRVPQVLRGDQIFHCKQQLDTHTLHDVTNFLLFCGYI